MDKERWGRERGERERGEGEGEVGRVGMRYGGGRGDREMAGREER